MYLKVILILSVFISSPVFSAENDFDKMCGYYERLDHALAINKMSSSQKTDFINNLVVNNLSENSSARKTWDVIIYAVPEERYDMVKSTAKELLQRDWKCEFMKKYISMTGK